MVDFDLPHRLPNARRPALILRLPELVPGVAAGLFAGMLSLILLLSLSTVVYDESPWKVLRMIAAVALGPGVLEPDDEFSFAIIAVAVVVHFALAMIYAFATAMLAKDLPAPAAPWIGLAFGVALYFANLYGFARVFPWFAPLRTFDTLLAHALFGIAAATIYRQFAHDR